jgi:hypothetical protein
MARSRLSCLSTVAHRMTAQATEHTCRSWSGCCKPAMPRSPGTNRARASRPQLDDLHVQTQRTQIVLDAIKVIKAHGDIDPKRIGLWGISQAGYVMPRVLGLSQDVAFMICVSCPGMSGYDQMAFQVTAPALCAAVPAEKTDQMTRLLSELDQTRTYETYQEYLHYREVIADLAELVSAPIERWPVLSEKDWNENNPDTEALWNPIEVIESVTVPVLALRCSRAPPEGLKAATSTSSGLGNGLQNPTTATAAGSPLVSRVSSASTVSRALCRPGSGPSGSHRWDPASGSGSRASRS